MPTTTYTDSTFAVTAIGGRTNSAGTGVSDWTAEESRLLAQILGEGALTTNAFIPAQQSVADMTVKIGAGTSKADVYVIAGDVTGQGNYVVRLDVASVNVTIGAADASQARTDEIYLVVQDTTYDASTRGLPRLGYRKGDLGGANPGVDSTWKASALIARITVPAGATTITTARISDQRVTGGLRLPQGSNLNVGGSTSTAYLAAAAFASTAETLSVGVVADTVSRLAVRGDGLLTWGTGSATGDTNLYRYGANALKTDDVFIAGGGLTVNGDLGGTGIGVARLYTTAGVASANTTPATAFTIPIQVAGTYLVEGFIHYAAAPNVGMSMSWTYPTSSTGRWSSGGIQENVDSRIGDIDLGMVDISVSLPVSGDSGGPSVEIAARPVMHIICTNTGNLVMKACQAASSGNVTTLRDTSFMRITRVS